MRTIALLLLAAFTPPSLAQQVTLPAEVRGEPGEFIVINAETTDTLVKWHVIDKGINLFPQQLQKDTKVAVVVSLKAGRYRLLAVSAKDGTPSDFAACTVIVGEPVVIVDPDKPPPDPDHPPPSTPTAATYVYEKDHGGVPPAVSAALNTINRGEKKIVATPFEEDTTDSTGQTPAQYTVALAAARTAGLPALVVTAGNQVLRVVKSPTTEAQVLEAVK